MNKKALYTELPRKVVADTKRLSVKLKVPMNKIVELALKEFIDSDPVLELSFKNASSSNNKKSK